MALIIMGLFIVLPILELYVLIKLGSWIGALPTIALLIVKAFAGAALLRIQGLNAMRRAAGALARGELPVGPMVDGMGLMLAGALLVTPGLITDTFGLLLFIPAVRQWLVRKLLGRSAVFANVGTPSGRGRGSQPGGGAKPGMSPDGGGRDGVVIEGEFERVDEKTVRSKGERRRTDEPDDQGGLGGPGGPGSPGGKASGRSPWIH